MNSQSGRGINNGRRSIGKLLSYILAGCAILTMTLGNCISIEAGRSLSLLQPSNNASGAGQVNKAVDLEIGKPIERELKGGEAHTYQVSLSLNQFLRVTVNQRGIDVAVNLFGPDGKQIVEVNSTGVTLGQEAVSAISDAAGSYRLEVRLPDKGALAGRYEIKIEELRPAIPQDSVRIAAERVFGQAEKLRSQGTAESLRKAIPKYEEALPLFRSVSDRRGESATLHNTGYVYRLLGEMQKALDSYYQALPVRRSVGDRIGEASTLTNIGLIYDSLGEKQKALDYYNQALPISRSTGDRAGEATALNNMGGTYNILGEKQKALDYYNQALPIWLSIGDRRGEAITLNNIGRVYDSLGEKQKALDHYNRSLPIRRSIGDRRGEATALNNIGFIYRTLGEMQKALEYFDQALLISRSTGDRAGEATALNNMGGTYNILGEKQKALDYYNQTLPLIRSTGDRRGEAITLNNIGRVYNSQGETQKAHDFYTQSLSLSRAVRELNIEAESLYEIARIKLNQGDFLQARSNIEPALQNVESLRVKVASPELRASYFASIQDYYAFYIDLLMRMHLLEPKHGYDALALQASERARARTLLEMLTEGRADIRQGVDLALLDRERSLQRLLDAKAERQTRLLNGKHTEQQAAELKKEIEQLLTQFQEVQSQIRASSPRYAALTQPQPLSLNQIQRDVLDSDTLLLEYALGDEHSYLWAITADSISSFVLPKRDEVQKAAQRVYDLLTARNRREQGQTGAQREARVKQAEADYDQAAAELSRMILGPVARQLGKKRLLVVADGALNYVPFAALPSPQDRQRLLIADHEIISLPSASSMAMLRRELAGRKTAPKAAAVLADPVFDAGDARVQSSIKAQGQKNGATDSASKELSELALMRSANEVGLTDRGDLPRLPFSRQEAEAIHALTGQAGIDRGGTRVALGFEASRETASSPDLGQYRIVHFATHGLLNTEHPELSGIVLSLVDRQGKPQNGFFRLYDVYNMNLGAELVVLSACQTALGKQVRGEGLIGLTRGFMYAGTARVMASLWRVEDEATAEMMKKFYEVMIKEGQRPATALRRAQEWMQRQKRWRAPYYWAGFILQGEWK
ncbi:MAG TPA: CHAT domain-containing tetratricopeptide repeat protein [Blastocatellia bacterium]|nr:CHAT domain-containing tetratricopeptide repeat protein [Blastocatellia bacterium]